MALGTQFDFTLHRGDDRSITFTVVDQATTPAAVDCTAATFKWNFSKKSASSTAPLGGSLITDKTQVAGITFADATNGQGVIALDSDDTSGLLPGDYYHELQITLTGLTSTLMYGVMTVTQDLLEPGPTAA